VTDEERARVRADFAASVNMEAEELADWLETAESHSVGFRRPGESESVGHKAGRRIVGILGLSRFELEDEDYRLMRKAVGFIRRHRAQEPANMVTSRWRYALMNWGHDPLK